MKKDPLYIVFGAWDKPTKALIGITRKDSKGKGIIIGQLKDSVDVEYGRLYEQPDIEGVYAVLWFCKKKPLDAMIDCLQRLRDTMEDEDGD